MADLSIQDVTESGLNATYSAAEAGGDTFDNDSSNRTFLHVKNGDGSQHTVTVTPIDATKEVQGYGIMEKSTVEVDVPAGEERFIGPFPRAAFGGDPDITYDDVTSVTIAALKV